MSGPSEEHQGQPLNWADPQARLEELRGLPPHEASMAPVRLGALPLLSAEELLRLRWAVQLGMATAAEDLERFGERMVRVLGSLDTVIAEAWASTRRPVP